MIPTPPNNENLPINTILVAGMGYSTVIADFDFETYSEAGFIWNDLTQKFHAPNHAIKKGLPTIGAAAYSEHPSTEVLSLAYDLKDGNGKRLWKPGEPNPLDLFVYLCNGGLLEAWNVTFERWIWVNVCTPKYNWPSLTPHLYQLRDALAKARAYALPGGLAVVSDILNIKNKKDNDGKRLLNLFSMPRNPTKRNASKRIFPHDDPINALKLYAYNLQDIAAEAEISSGLPDLSPEELEFWLADQAINFRGVQLDRKSIQCCISIVEQCHKKYNAELQQLTKGTVEYASEVQKLRNWMMNYGVHSPNLDQEAITKLLSIPTLPVDVRRALHIRELIGSAAVKKLYSMMNQITKNDRVHDIFIYHAARTGRAAGAAASATKLT